MLKISRTALKELKARYLGILKKCAYLNAIVFSISPSFPAIAVTVDDFLADGQVVTGSSDAGTLNFSLGILGGNTSNPEKGGKWLNNGGQLSLGGSKLYFSGFEATSLGGAIYNGETGRINFSRAVSFTSNKAANGGAIYNHAGVISGITETIENGNTIYTGGLFTFKENIATNGSGGAIYNDVGSTINMYQGLFQGNTAKDKGGAIYNNGQILFADKSQFSAVSSSAQSAVNSAYQGGAIYNDVNGQITFKNTAAFSRSNAVQGGSIYNIGGRLNTDGSILAYGLIFEGQASFVKSNGDNKATDGGAVYNNGTIKFGGQANFGSASEGGNTGKWVTNAGGAIYNGATGVIDFTANSNSDASDVLFVNNGFLTDVNAGITNDVIKTQKGGAIYNAGKLNFGGKTDFGVEVIQGTTVSKIGNKAVSGGAIYNDTNGQINFAQLAQFTANEASTNGGAIYNIGAISFYNGASFSSNTAGLGGAIYNDGGTLSFLGTTLFDSNTATAAPNGVNGGGALQQTTGLTSFSGDVTFKNNWAEKQGGAISVLAEENTEIRFADIASTTPNQVLFENNGFFETTNANGTKTTNVKADNGGAIYSKGKFLFNNTGLTSFKGNKAVESGGAIEANRNNIMTFAGEVKFESNTSENGGAINSTAGSITFDNGVTFDANMATNGSGGAINQTGGSVIFKGNTLFEDNTSLAQQQNKVASGGAISSNGGTITFYDVASSSTGSTVAFENNGFVVTENTDGTKTTTVQTKNGGAIYSKGTLTFNNTGLTSFKGNKAQNGGAIEGNWGNNMTFNSAVKFDSNAATEGQGGAINSTSGSIIFNEKATFNSNTAITYGGAIYNSNILNLLGSTSEFSLNTAQLGGAIYNDGGTLSFSGTTLFDANTATSSSDSLNGGGALHQTRGVTSFSGDVTFKNNWAEKHGGAMGLTGGTITFADVASSSTGSAVTFENNGFVVTENMDGTKTTTVKTDNGGAIYSKGKLTFNNTGLTGFKGNIAETGGAIYNQGEISFLDATAQQNISQKSVQFKGNGAVDNFSEDGSVLGGAVYNEGTIDFNNNVLFGAETSDLADQDGNKVYAEVDSADGSQTIVNALGGAVYNKGLLDFNGDETKFSYNKALVFKINADSNDNAYGYGGAVYNDEASTINFTGGSVVFESNIAHESAGALFNSGTVVFGVDGENGTASFLNNKTQASISTDAGGGAIWNKADITFYHSANFGANDASQGGALFNSGKVKFKAVDFNNNTAIYYGGAIYNTSSSNDYENGVIDILGVSEFTNNTITANDDSWYLAGGAIYNAGKITFKDSTSFVENKIIAHDPSSVWAYGGAIYNGGEMTFKDNAVFSQNSTVGVGGAIYNIGNLALENNFKFVNNISSSGRDINNNSSLTISHSGLGTFDSGIYNEGVIKKSGEGTLVLGDQMVNEFAGNSSFEQSKGRVIANSDTFAIAETNQITDGVFETHGGNISNQISLSGNNTVYKHYSTADGVDKTKLNTTLALGNGVDAYFDAYTQTVRQDYIDLVKSLAYDATNNENGIEYTDAEIGRLFTTTALANGSVANYSLENDIATNGASVYFRNSRVSVGGTSTFSGAYDMDASTMLDLTSDGKIGSVSFNQLTGSDTTNGGAKLLFDIQLVATPGDGLTLKSDAFTLNENTSLPYYFNADLLGVNVLSPSVGDNGVKDTYVAQVLFGNAHFNTSLLNSTAVYLATDVYEYKISLEGTQSIKLSGIDASGPDSLKNVNQYDGQSKFLMTVVNSPYVVGSDLGETGSGEKIIEGATVLATDSVIKASGRKLFNVVDSTTDLTVQNLTIDSALSALTATTGKTEFNNVIFDNQEGITVSNLIENKGDSNLTLKNVQMKSGVGSILNEASLTVQESVVQDITNTNVLNVTNSTLSDVENSGTLTSIASLLTSLVNEGQTKLDTTDVVDLTNLGTLFVSGGKIDVLKNSDEAELENAEVMDLTNLGTLVVSGGKIDVLKNSNKADLENAEVTDLTNFDTFSAIQSVLKSVQNSGSLTLLGGQVDTLSNTKDVNVNGSTINNIFNHQGTTILENAVVNTEIVNKDKMVIASSDISGSILNEGEMVADDLDMPNTLQNIKDALLMLTGDNKFSSVVDNDGVIQASNGSLTFDDDMSGDGILTVTDALLSLPDEFKTSNHLVSNNLTFSDNVKSLEVGDLTVENETELDLSTIKVTAQHVHLKENSSLKVDLNNLTEFGQISASGLTSETGSTIDFNLGDDFEAGIYHVLKSDGIVSLPTAIHDDAYEFIDLADGRYSFISQDTNETADKFGSDKNETEVIEALHQGTGANDNFNQMQSEIVENLQSKDLNEKQKALEALNAIGSDFNPIIESVATEHFRGITDAVSDHEKSLTTGRAGGDFSSRASMFAKGLYSRTKDKDRGNYKIHETGGVIGVQSKLTDELTVGLGYAYGNADAKQANRDTNVNTNTGFVFAKYQPYCWFIDALMSYSRSQYEEDKYILSTRGSADYNVDTFAAQTMIGFSKKISNNTVITPKVGVRYMNIHQESYTDSLGTKVDQNSYEYLTGLLGVDAKTSYKTKGGIVVSPKVGVLFGYDAIADDMKGVDTLSNNATYVVSGDALPRLSTNLNVGVAAKFDNNTTVEFDYTASFRSSYQDHGGMIKFKYHF